MKSRKLTLILIVSLLVIFLPLSLISLKYHKEFSMPKEENPHHQFKYEDSLYFYIDNKLVGKYQCSSLDNYCDYALNRNPNEYSLNEYKMKKSEKIPLINNHYAFLMDDLMSNTSKAEIFLYDIINQRTVMTFKEVKNYGIGIDGDYYLVKNTDDKWGVIDFKNDINSVISYKYDYIGLLNDLTYDKKINSEVLVVKQNNKWKLIDITEKDLTNEFNEEIVHYDGTYIILKSNNEFKLVNYTGINYFGKNFSYMEYYEKYLVLIDLNSNFYIYDIAGSREATNQYPVESIEDVHLEKENDIINIYVNEVLKENIAIK